MENFLWRRVHSLMGLWLVLYLILHLTVNSQAAFWISREGSHFVRMVNSLESLPFLHVVEITLIGIPLLVHGFWGIRRIFSAKTNQLPFERNRAFTWQRLTSWILLFGILAHVAQMRFLEMPKQSGDLYIVKVTQDQDLKQLAKNTQVILQEVHGQWEIAADSPGKAMLFMVRETFKSPALAILYSIFVLAAAFHAFNGLWTSLITWGVLLSYRSQKAVLPLCWAGSILLSFLGLAAIWGSYFLAGTL